jgi:hypothetical protein
MSSIQTRAGEKLVIVVDGSESGNCATISGGGLGGVMIAQDDNKPAIREGEPNFSSFDCHMLQVESSEPTGSISFIISGGHSLISR